MNAFDVVYSAGNHTITISKIKANYSQTTTTNDHQHNKLSTVQLQQQRKSIREKLSKPESKTINSRPFDAASAQSNVIPAINYIVLSDDGNLHFEMINRQWNE